MRLLLTVLGAALVLSAADSAQGVSPPRASAGARDSTSRRLIRRPAADKAPRASARLRRAPGREPRAALERATPGEKVPVVVTYYCLKGLTRNENAVREGIVAADPRVFPLRRHVDLSVRGRPLGRFLVDDTGGKIVGNTLDIWLPSCADARRRGRHRATAVLLTREESRAEHATRRKLEQERKQRVAKG